MLDSTPLPTRAGAKPKQSARAAAPAKRQRATREPKVSKTAVAAWELLCSGGAKNISDAARQLGCSRENLSRQFSKPHVKLWMASTVKLDVSLSAGRAWVVKRSLLEAQSEHVRSDCASEILALSGIQAPRAPTTAIQINNNGGQSVGYVLNISGWAEEDVVGGLERGDLEYRNGVVIDPKRTAAQTSRALAYSDAEEVPRPSRA